MASERFLVVLKESVSPQTTNRIVTIIDNLGGNVEIIASHGKAIIATLDSSFAESIRRLPYVELVGGVTIGRRTLMRKRTRKQ